MINQKKLKINSHKCRSCEGILFKNPLLSYKNSPESAQNFIDDLSVSKDNPVTIDIYQCSKCGLIQHNLDPVSYYKKVIRAVSFSNEMFLYRVRQLNEWVTKYSLKNKSILEVGSGRGEYLNIFKEIGANKIFGMEYDYNNYMHILSEGYKATNGYLDAELESLNGGPFDAFAIFSFMEHWPDPKLSLETLSLNLSNNAYGLIEVPNFQMIRDKGLYTEFTVDHIFYFDHKTLSNFLNTNGFEILNIKNIWNDYIISAEIIKREPIDVKIFEKKFSLIKLMLNDYLDNNKNNKTIVWGAGHQALAVISLTGIKKKISYIVDSATFKQNKYTPESHLMIHHPEYLINDKPDSIIVMAAGFSDEIVKIIYKNYSFIKSIAVLREDYLEIIK
jgi:hypothetical protein